MLLDSWQDFTQIGPAVYQFNQTIELFTAGFTINTFVLMGRKNGR